MRLPLILIVVLLVVSVLMDIYVTYDIRSCTRRRGWWRVYLGLSVACWLYLLVVACLPKRSEDGDIVYLMWMLYGYLAVYASKSVYVLASLGGRLVRPMFKPPLKWHPSKWAGLVLALGLGVVMWRGVADTRRHIVVDRIAVESDKLPPAFDGFTIAQISDIHVGTWGNDTTFVSALVDSVNALHPDLIVFTGDIVNRKTAELSPFVSVLSRLKAKYGVLSVLGNHDYGDYVDWSSPWEREQNNKRLAQTEHAMGWNLLNNSRTVIKCGSDSIIVAGVENWGDPPFHTYGDLEKALPSSPDSVASQNDGNFKILLSHNPEHWVREVSTGTNIDLTLSGHTHAMQMVLQLGKLRWSPAVWRYPTWGGLYSVQTPTGRTSNLYVNTGAGEVGMPARLFAAYPEITLLTLKSTVH